MAVMATPSLWFPCPQGEPNRRAAWFPSRSGGNLKEGGIYELWIGGWYQTTMDSHQTTIDSYQTTMDRRQVNRTAGECSRARRMGRMSHEAMSRGTARLIDNCVLYQSPSQSS